MTILRLSSKATRLVSHRYFLQHQLILGILSKKLALSHAQIYPLLSSVVLPFLHPWFTEACGEAVVLKQLAFASWKENPTEGISVPSIKLGTSVCLSSGKPETTSFSA